MRCKPGDIAVIVRSAAGNEGRLVTIGRWLGEVDGFAGDDRWEVIADRPLMSMLGLPHFHAQDSWMCPIRPDSEPESTDTPRELEAA